MKSKVCHITSAHSRYDTRIFLKECVSLAKSGFDVFFLVAEKIGTKAETINGVTIVPVAIEPKNRIDRIINSPKILLEKAIQIDADIYHFHDPELLQITLKLKGLGKKVIFDSHEDYPVQILDKKWIPWLLRPLISYLYTLYSSHILKQLDYLIGVSPHITEKLEMINHNVELITNYPILCDKEIKGKKNKNQFGFAGGISDQWNHQVILKALEKIDAKYSLMGNGEEKYINDLKNFKAWDKVTYYGRIPQQEVRNKLSSCIAGIALANYTNNGKQKLGTLGNTKLFEFMESGLAFICTDFIMWKEIIDKWKCGICIPPGDVNALQKAMQYMIDNPDKAKEMGENGRQAVLEEFNWGIEEKKLISLYRKLEMSHGVHAV